MADGFDFSPGAQVPLSGGAGQTAATQALASAAYRDSPLSDISKADSDAHKSEIKKPKLSLFAPNLGEAYSRAVQVRMLGGGRKALIQSFGTEPQAIVEHCLSATRLRKQRDARLTLVMVLFGLLFLPGVLLWLGAFQLKKMLSKDGEGNGLSLLGGALLTVLAGAALFFMVKLPLNGFWPLYFRAMAVAPVVGWWWAKQICEKAAVTMREAWKGLLEGGGVAAKIPEAVPQDPNETAAETLRQNLAKVTAEQHSNVVFYAGPKGILGMGTRWGSWQLAEELVPAEEGTEIHPFRSWDVVRVIHDRLRLLERSPLHTGGFPAPSVRHWIVSPVGEKAGAVARPDGTDTDAFQIRPHEIERICNEQQFGAGNRHYLGVQFVLWDGQLVLTLMITVTVLHETLRIEVTGHALGPVNGLFTSKPEPKTKDVAKTVRFWETKKITLPLIDSDEVVRLAARAPLTWFPPVLDFLGGKLTLPEPFGLRHVWADKPWRHRFMADDALRAATPVLRVVHSAAMSVLKENGVDTERFTNRSLVLSGMVQGAEPKNADEYHA
ncbi:membrane protein [Streptomyces chattanoogensis]|uniref:Membrane protein n=1 Tax=Streptomyces chattanoogensis TaxID=66876 RepID=A0A0N0XY21_9ACTN|nr:membrane protein [Streptomyces chattanoogensis]